MKIAVFCASSDTVSADLFDRARDFGEMLGKSGHDLVYGGYDKGIMGTVANAVAESGGKVISVIPELFQDTNAFGRAKCDKTILVKTMADRKKIMEDEADAIVVLPGGIGTMDEFFDSLSLSVLDELKAPIFVYSVCKSQAILKTLLEAFVEENMASANIFGKVSFVGDLNELFDLLGKADGK